MATLEMNFPDDMFGGLLDSEFSDIAEEALTETAPILEESIKKSIKGVISHSDNSELVNSVKTKGPKKTRTDGYIINIGPTGSSKTHYYAKDGKGRTTSRTYPVSNALKAVWLEYGNAHQSPKPWLTTATKNAESKILNKMQEIYNKKVGAK